MKVFLTSGAGIFFTGAGKVVVSTRVVMRLPEGADGFASLGAGGAKGAWKP